MISGEGSPGTSFLQAGVWYRWESPLAFSLHVTARHGVAFNPLCYLEILQTKVGMQYWCTTQNPNVFKAIPSMEEKGGYRWPLPMKSRKQTWNVPPFFLGQEPPKTRPWVPTPASSRALAGGHSVHFSEFAKRSRWQSWQITLQSSNTAAEVSAHFFLSC